MKDGYANMCKVCCKKYVKYRREKLKQEQKEKPKPKFHSFYSPTTPRSPAPQQSIHIVRENIQINFD